MSDDDLIRRGDVLASIYGDPDGWTKEAIAALPAAPISDTARRYLADPQDETGNIMAGDMRAAPVTPELPEAHEEQLGVWADELMADLVLGGIMELVDYEYDTKIAARKTIIDALKSANQAKVPPAPVTLAQALPPHIAVRMGSQPEFYGKVVIRNLNMDSESDMVVIEPEHVDAVIAALAALEQKGGA